jgi:predicted  nucleic acid-binding Zn-ribbon protein
MTISEYLGIGTLFLGCFGAITTAYINIMTKITAQQTEICNLKNNFNEHKKENNNTFSEISKVLEKVSELHYNVGLNSERIIAITAQFDEHKLQNDKSFEAIIELVKQNRQDNKDEHTELKQIIKDAIK